MKLFRTFLYFLTFFAESQIEAISIKLATTIAGNSLLKGNLIDFVCDGVGPFSFTIIKSTGGNVMCDENGYFSFLAQPEFNGIASFCYEVTDTLGQQALGMMDILVSAPRTRENQMVAHINSSIAGDLNEFVNEGFQPYRFKAIKHEHGNIEIMEDGRYSFTMEKDYRGLASFDYQVVDALDSMTQGRILFDVSGPVVMPAKLRISGSSIYGNLQDYVISGNGPYEFFMRSSSCKDSIIAIDQYSGAYSIFLPINYKDICELSYTVIDSEGMQNTGILEIVANEVPKLRNIRFITPINTELHGHLKKGVDGDGSNCNFELVDTCTHGTVTLESDGSFTFYPKSNFIGTAEFTYRLVDRARSWTSNCATATINIDRYILSPENKKFAATYRSILFKSISKEFCK